MTTTEHLTMLAKDAEDEELLGYAEGFRWAIFEIARLSANIIEPNTGVSEDDITQAMIQAGRYAANLNDGTLGAIYIAMANAALPKLPSDVGAPEPENGGSCRPIARNDFRYTG